MTTEKNRKSGRYGKRVLVAILAVVLLMALSITAMAYPGLLGWIFVDRDLETEQRSEAAGRVLNDFAGIMQEPSVRDDEQSGAPPEEADGTEVLAKTAVNWLAGQHNLYSWSDIKLSDFAAEREDGSIVFYFSPGEEPLLERTITVAVGADGSLYGIDFRMAAYPQAEACPEENREEYLTRSTHLGSGIEYYSFNIDAYLMEVAYPDTTDYAPLAEAAAADAMRLLSEDGFINADLDTIEIIYFEIFNGGAAWIDVLMENGDVYCLYLQPDDFSILGFALNTKEHLDSGNGNAPLYEALRKGALTEYLEKQKELYANGVG